VRLSPYESGALPPVFAMNLPEGYVLSEIRDRLAKVVRIDPLLLLAITGDSHPIGRLVLHSDALAELLPDRVAPPSGEKLDEILHWKGGGDLFDELVDRYVLRSGISGIQPKVLVPERGRANTAELIVKSGRDEYPHLAINEYICMTIAKTAGLAVPEFWLSDDRELFVMRRFDADASGARLGFEDFAALTGRQPEQKYEGSYRMLATAIRTFVAIEAIPAALAQLFDTVALSSAVGNGDAHLKNFGVLYTHPAAGDVRLAPVYDIVNTTMYIENDSLALKLGGDKAFAGRARLAEFADECDLADGDARIDRIVGAVETVFEGERGLLDDAPDLKRAIERRIEALG
ncbi:MAG TPA: type II toxin-antitoxin system HipA family toxin, partial [Rhodanobacteraceae bacterium]|nr:type II toxin-antitoxin system HipA family toxin [Rhodanobacteraceae bacterium]